MRWPLYLVIAFLFALASTARADEIDRHVRELGSDRSYKVRLSAALWLAKKKDVRAVDAFGTALEKDVEARIREVAAKALGDILSAKIPADVRSRAFAALLRAKSADKDRGVRRRAKRTLDKLARLRASTPAPGQTVVPDGKPPRAVFVHVGKPNMGKHKTPKGTDSALARAVSDQLQKKLGTGYFRLGSEDSELPTEAELQRDEVRGWFVGATVAGLAISSRGNKAEVRCTVTMRVNPWNGKDGSERLTAQDTAAAEGSAKVEGPNNKRDIEESKRACLVAVAEQLTGNRIAPFLQERNPVTKQTSSREAESVRVSRARAER